MSGYESGSLGGQNPAGRDGATLQRLTASVGFVDRLLPELFLLIALPMTLFFVLATPPFQVPDEFAHLFRADQISYGEIVGTKIDEQNSGGHIDTSFLTLSRMFLHTDAFCQVLHPERIKSSDRDLLSAASQIAFTGHREFVNCPNTITYGPFMYIPQAVALGIARLYGMKALNALYLARGFNGLAGVATGFLALRLAGRGRFVIFCLLTMPITLFLMGSVSQDSLLLSGSALVIAIASKTFATGQPPKLSTYIALTILLVALAWGRLPYLMLAFVFLLSPFAEMRWRNEVYRIWPRLAAITCVIVLAGVWSWSIKGLLIDLRPSVSAHQQAQFLLAHLRLIPEIAFNTLKQTKSLAEQCVGVLGWLDVRLAKFFYPLALLGLTCAFALETTRSCGLNAADRWIAALAVAGGVGATYLAIYLTWEPVGQLSVNSVQARYIIPFLFALVFTLPTLADPAKKWLTPLILMLPVVAILGAGVSVAAMVSRYY